MLPSLNPHGRVAEKGDFYYGCELYSDHPNIDLPAGERKRA